MRMLPFFKPKKGFMIAGGGLETSSGGGGGGGGGQSIHFSTSEFSTGWTWTDNKPIYGIVKHVTSGSTTDLPSDIDKIIMISGMTTGTSKMAINYYDDGSYNVKTSINVYGQIQYSIRGWSDSADVIVFYTKNS